MLKYATFPGRGSVGLQTVCYWRTENTCVFCGVTSGTGTINAAEEVITAICKEENVSPQRLTFFDLQSKRGYSYKEPGEFAYDRLVIEVRSDGIFCKDWVPTTCPEDVIKMFGRFMAGIPDQTNDPRNFGTSRYRF